MQIEPCGSAAPAEKPTALGPPSSLTVIGLSLTSGWARCLRSGSYLVSGRGDEMHQLISLRWSDARGEGSIKLDPAFFEADWVVQADALQDWRTSLDRLYEILLTTHKEISADTKLWD